MMRRLVGLAAVSVLLVGCADDGVINDSITTLKPGGASMAYALNLGTTQTLQQYSLATSGAVTPQATLSLPAGFEETAIAVDAANGTIYLGGLVHGNSSATPTIYVYAAGSAGAAAPTTSITSDGTVFGEIASMAVDNAGKLYVVSQALPTVTSTSTIAQVVVFGPGATGAATPLRTIAGSATGLYLPTAITADAIGNIYVANADSAQSPYSGVIVEFSSTSTGNVAPARSITNLKQIFNGVAVDRAGNIYAVQETETVAGNVTTFSAPQISVFGPTASGPATPSKVISGTNTGMGTVGEIQVDAAGNMYVSNQTVNGAATTSSVLGFAPVASGNQAPALKLTSTALTAGSTQFALK